MLCSANKPQPSQLRERLLPWSGSPRRASCLPALPSLGFLLEGKVRPIKSGSIESLIDINETDRQLGRLGGGGRERGAGALDEKEMEIQPNSTAAFLILYVYIS